MSNYSTVGIEEITDETSVEINRNTRKEAEKKEHKGIHFIQKGSHRILNYTTEVIKLPNDGQVEIAASRRFGGYLTSSRSKDEVTLTLSHGEVVRVVVTGDDQHTGPDILRRCGARIPHGPVVLDTSVSGILIIYSLLLTVLLAHVRGDWKYLFIIMIWFLYVILRINTYNEDLVNITALKRRVWHFTGISFSIMFMYATLMVVFPLLTQDAFYQSLPKKADVWSTESFIMPSLKASVGFTLLGMAARRSFHCGKILNHMDIIKSILLDNVDIFNLIETLGLRNGDLPMISKDSALYICILVACEVAFLIIALEALMPYSLMVLDAKSVGKIKQNMSIRESKEQAILMVYPYSLMILNIPFLIIRMALFAQFNTLQLAYVIKNITSIIFGSIALIRARYSLKQQQVKREPEFVTRKFQQRRISI